MKTQLLFVSILFLFLLNISSGFSQTLINELWEIELNYPQDIAWSASVLTSSSDMITTGNTWHDATQKVNIVTTKKNSSGTVIWNTEYNGTLSGFDYGSSICLDGSGNVYVAGATHNTSALTFDIVIIKYNSSGVQQWATLFNGSGSGMDIPSGITLDGSGNIYVCGAATGSTTGYDYVTIKLNSSGTIQWNQTYDYASLTDAPGFIAWNSGTSKIGIAGASQSSGSNWDYTTLKYDASGTLTNTNRSSAAGYGYDRPTDLVIDGSGNFYITGYAYNGSDYDMRTIKLDDDLSPIWTVTDDDGDEDGSNSIAIDGSHNTYVTGFAVSSSGDKRIKIVKYNSSGTFQWQTILENFDLSIDGEGVAIEYNSLNSTVVVTGFYEFSSGVKSITTIGVDPADGDIIWKEDYPNLTGSIDDPTNMHVSSNHIWIFGTRNEGAEIRYITIKYEIYEHPTEYVLDESDNPIYIENEILIRFNPELLDIEFIDNKQQVYSNLALILDEGFYDVILPYLQGENSQFTPKGVKIYKNFTSEDNTSISRSGKTVLLPEFWASLIVTCDASMNVIELSDSLALFPENILYAHPNWIATQFDTPDDEEYDSQESIHYVSPNDADSDIEVEGAWDMEVGEENIKVGILENALDWSHEDFGDGTLEGSKIKDGYDFVNNVDFEFIGLPLTNDHGTNTTGIIGALRNNGIGIAGIAGGDEELDNIGVSLYEYKVFSETGVSTISYISDALANAAISGPEEYQGVDILNFSGGFDYIASLTDFQELQTAVDMLYRNEVVFCVARGQTNETEEDPGDPFNNTTYPAGFLQNKNHWVIVVGAAGNDGERKTLENSDPGDENDEWFSYIGAGIDLIAPGTSDMVWTTGISSDVDPENDYIFFRNTSAATPHVTGVAGLMLSYVNNNPAAYNELAPDDVEWIIQETADNTEDFPAEYDDFTGHGMLNATNAMEALELPYYRVIHYPTGEPTTLDYYLQEDPEYIKIWISDPPGAYAAGIYLAEVWDVDFIYNHSIPGSATFIAGWLRNSTTTGMEPISLDEGDYIIPNIDNVRGSDYLDAFDITSTTAKIKSRVYKITHTLLGAAVTPFWYPLAPADVDVNYSIYIYDQNATVSVPTINEESGFQVFPNPANDVLNIYFEFSNSVYVEVFDIDGRKVKFGDFNISENTIDISDLSLGLYFVTITTGDQKLTSKFVKL